MEKAVRRLEISVISDVHLATHASKAKKLLRYLKSVHPGTLILNGDFIDSWRFSRNYFPKPQLKVLRHIIKMLESGTRVIYITGNHDEVFRKFNNIRLGNFELVNQATLNLNGNLTWIFHGDIFDLTIHQAKWLAKLGAAAYGLITMLNKAVNLLRAVLGKHEVILYKSFKDRVLKDRKALSKFERTLAHVAMHKKMNTVICGHTHVPVDKVINYDGQSVHYINCGDWVEHCTAAEYSQGAWRLHHFNGDDEDEPDQQTDELFIPEGKQLYRSILEEFAVVNLLKSMQTA